MNRDDRDRIKIWDKKENYWACCETEDGRQTMYLIHPAGHLVTVTMDESGVWESPQEHHDEERYVKVRCTGVRDNVSTEEHPDGKLIFEGDIVRAEYLLSDLRTTTVTNSIEYRKGCYWLGQIPIAALESREVIGNKCENPELLDNVVNGRC